LNSAPQSSAKLLQIIQDEFPRITWTQTVLFGSECIMGAIKRTRVYIKNQKNFTFGIDVEHKGMKWSQRVNSFEQLKNEITYYSRLADPEVVKEIQTSLF